jgi:hypothetical protein
MPNRGNMRTKISSTRRLASHGLKDAVSAEGTGPRCHDTVTGHEPSWLTPWDCCHIPDTSVRIRNHGSPPVERHPP